jgi:hypothetical protein
MINMSEHQAVEQMLGYLYQVRYALFLLLENDDEQAQISIEKFDDISFSHDDTSEIRIQLKHHTKAHGDLSDASTDMWRTIKVWADLVNMDTTRLTSTKFIIITTAKAPNKTAASYLKPVSKENERDTNAAFNILKAVTGKSKNLKHMGYYNAFIKLGDELGQKLVDSIYIIDGSSNIIDVKADIMKIIRYGSLPKYEQRISERLEGWWYDKSIEYLSSDQPVFVSQKQIRSVIAAIRDEYTEENLPIDIPALDGVEIENLPENDRVFYEQLKLICVSNKRIKLAIRDYYRAFTQRANWIRDDLLYVNELGKYEERLIDEWQRMFLTMQEDLEEYGDELDEGTKQKHGKALFNKIQDKDIRIRDRCSEPFIMRGSYHSLANRLSVGWHTNFENRLRMLLTMQGEL